MVRGSIMSEKELKIGDIAHLTGLSEQDVRRLIQTYDSLFTYRTIGPVRLFPQKTVKIVQELMDLSRKGLTPEEVTTEVKSGRKAAAPEEPAPEVERTGVPLPPEVVLDLRVMQETLARQERRIAQMAAELERVQEERRKEADRHRETVNRLEERLDKHQRDLVVVAEWVDYFDGQLDEVSRPVLDRVRRAFGTEHGPD
ncbi:hypothetical protein [Methanoculleus sp.]|uniref:hypothetical protein n=1 Tax=Methanoculleus sp. TaxID=90427 RepID=UPI002FCAB1D0